MKNFLMVASLTLSSMTFAGNFSPAMAIDETMTEKAESAANKADKGDTWGAMRDYRDALDEAAKPDNASKDSK